MVHPKPPEELPASVTLGSEKQVQLIVACVGALLVLLLLLAVVRNLLNPSTTPEIALPPGAFRPTTAELADLRIEPVRSGEDPAGVAAIGTISVDEDHSTPVVLPYSGQVLDVLVQAGQRVVRGQPLMKIASSDFVDARNTLLSAAAQSATAASQLKSARDNERRQAAIFASAGGALKDYRQAESDLVAAQSTMRSSESALAAARDKMTLLGKSPDEVSKIEVTGKLSGRLGQTIYRAPVAGTIAARNVAPGQYVSTGGDKPVMTISDLTHVWLVAQVDQTLAAQVHLGDAVKVTTPAYPGRVFHAVIDNIGAALDPVTHRLPVRATVENPDEALKPEMFASFSIQPQSGSSAVLVPASAVIHEGDSTRVWVAGRDGLLFARAVTVSDSSDGFEKISAGLRPGEMVVTSGAIFVNEAGLGE
jgi:cobalt-zinc-cadmium efflux system membrane fusion protein